MKIRHWLIAAFFCMSTLISCTHTYTPTSQDFLRENWMHNVNLNPMNWTHGADRWFFTGEPTPMERYANRAPSDTAMSVTEVKVPQFTHIKIDGCFRVQLTGGQPHNALVILGPNEALHQIVVQVWGDTIVVTQVHDKDPKKPMANLKNVIVRIAVSDLRHLTVRGGVDLEGRLLVSDGMVIEANNSGTVLLNGHINLLKVHNSGPGTVSVIGAYTPCLDISVGGSGTVNVSGRVGIQSVYNVGAGKVNIIGADSRSLVVNACGNSFTAIAGYVNLKRLNAADNACVYIYWVKSPCASVTLSGNARVGLAGTVGSLDLLVADNARFGGQYLHGRNIEVQTHGSAHANVAADRKIFASAVDKSSIYSFGSSAIVSSYTAGYGTIVPVWNATAMPFPAYAPQFMTSVNNPPRSFK